MAQVHCLSTKGVMLDQCWADVDDLTEVMPGPEDWRNWALHASDELGQEILVMPFSSARAIVADTASPTPSAR